MRNHMSVFALIAAISVASVAASSVNACASGNMDAGCTFKKVNDWAWIMFVETWPGTFCRDGCCKVPSGVSSITNGFTIHGFWPNYEGSAYPFCCASDYTKGEVETLVNGDRDLKNALDTYWPALKKCKFVEYEYEKHGTCASTVYNGTNGIVDYLSTGMNILRKWNFQTVLAQHGIVPSTSATYELSKVKAALSQAVGAQVAIECDNSDGSLFLEARICFQRPNDHNKLNPVPFDCPKSASESGCKSSIKLLPIPRMASGGCSQ